MVIEFLATGSEPTHQWPSDSPSGEKERKGGRGKLTADTLQLSSRQARPSLRAF